MDENVRGAVTRELRRRGIDLLTVQEDGAEEAEDSWVLDRSTQLGRVLFSQDEDLLSEAVGRQRRSESFTGVIYAHQLEVPIGRCIEDLELIAGASEPVEFADQVRYLPLR
jgi:hypothetical protein